MNIRLMYSWEIETKDGQIFTQYSDGKEQTWKNLSIETVVRCSFVSTLPIFPRHDVLIDILSGEQFIKRFGRGFLKSKEDGLSLKEYINCCMTNKYRFWVFNSCGRTLVTKNDYEVYL
jgi:hypothetical protein